LWDVASGKERSLTTPGHQSSIRSLAVSADGTLAATAAGESDTVLWQLASGKELGRLRTPSNYFAVVRAMALSADAKLVLTDSGLWDRVAGKRLASFKDLEFSVEAVAFAPDGRTAATAVRDSRVGKDSAICIWDTATGRQLRHLSSRPVHAVAYSPDSKVLASRNGDGTVSLWDVATGREVQCLKGHRREVDSVAFSSDRIHLASSSFDGDIFLWDASAGRKITQLVREDPRANPQVLAVAFAPDSRMLASAEQPFTSSEGQCITLWEVATGGQRLRLAGHAGDVNCVAFAKGSRHLVTASTDATALVWDLPAAASPRAAKPEVLWADLASPKAATAYRALCGLVKSEQGIAFLGRHLRPAPTAEAARLEQLVQHLDDDSFDARTEAARELESLGEAAEAILQKASQKHASAEVRSRAKGIVDKLSGEWLRTRRAVEALELAAAPAANQVLQTLAEGAPNARKTQEAKLALRRRMAWVSP
jgi:WD40 repeat protein